MLPEGALKPIGIPERSEVEGGAILRAALRRAKRVSEGGGSGGFAAGGGAEPQ